MLVTKRSLYYWILHRHYGLQLLLLLVIVISLFFRIVPLEMQKRIINQAIELKNYQLLFLYCGVYFAAVLLAGISKYAINYLQVLIGQKILVEIRTRLSSSWTRQHRAWTTNHRPGFSPCCPENSGTEQRLSPSFTGLTWPGIMTGLLY